MSNVESEKIIIHKSKKRANILYYRFESSNIPPKIVKFLIRKKIVKTEARASLLLVLLVVLLVAVSVLIFMKSGHSSSVISTDAVMKALFKK